MDDETAAGSPEAPDGGDLAQAAEAEVHRFKAEPLFSKTGTGSLSSASTSERAQEAEHSTELIQKLEQRARQSGSKPEGGS